MSIWRGPPLVLASKSVARRAVLQGAGLPFDVAAADIDERALELSVDGPPQAVARALAEAKARGVAKQYNGCIVIGADQTLALGARLFHKPDGRDAARAQLLDLQGRAHTLHSAVCVMTGESVIASFVIAAQLTMRTLTSDQIESYLDAAGDAVTTSVGGYQLEALGVHLFETIDGDHFTILGLPLLPLLSVFREQGWLAV